LTAISTAQMSYSRLCGWLLSYFVPKYLF